MTPPAGPDGTVYFASAFTPDSTWFQTAPSHVPSRVSWVYHCCWEPEVMVPETRESDRYPPDE